MNKRIGMISKITTIALISSFIYIGSNNDKAYAAPNTNEITKSYTNELNKSQSGKLLKPNTSQVTRPNTSQVTKPNTSQVTTTNTSKVTTSSTKSNVQTGKIKACDYLNVRSGASADYSVVTKVYTDDIVEVLDKHSNGWIKIKAPNGKIGWVNGKYVESQTTGSISSNFESGKHSNIQVENKAKKVVDLAHKQIGKPYVWGASGPNSFDCSGFTSYVYKHGAGVDLPRTSTSQATVGKTVSKENLKPGDLVFFSSNGKRITHVGLYIGNSNMIHSPKPGENVRIESINSSYYRKTFVTAKTIL